MGTLTPSPKRPARTTRTIRPAHPKPPGCSGCSLEHRGTGFVPPDGPLTSPILFIAEAPAWEECVQGRPLVGAAGSMFTKVLRMSGYLREDYRVANTISCVPPELSLEGQPFAAAAISHCSQYLDPILAEGHQVVVPLGAVALRRVLGLQKVKGVRVQDFHGTVSRDPTDRYWCVPTFHPSHLQRGATNLLGTVSFDLQRAHEIAQKGRAPDPATVVCDPPLSWFQVWCRLFLVALRDDPDGVWLAVDIETPDKGADEGELLATGGDASYQILRVNLSCHPDEGITVPFEGEYIAALADLFAEVQRLNGTTLMWFRGFDMPRLLAAGIPFNPRKVWDLMWLAKVFQSDLPMGLGFWAPFYSSYGPWKHLASTHPVQYAAVDGFQTLRVGHGLVEDVVTAGMWPVFERHLHDFHTLVLQPASDVGVPIDRQRLTEFGVKLDTHAQRLLTEIQQVVPDELRPLTPKEGLSRAPAPGDVHTKGRTLTKRGAPKVEAPDPIKQAFYAQAAVVTRLVLREVWACLRCGAREITKRHRCEDGDKLNERQVTLEPATVTRWYWQEPFNPDSPPQLLSYIKFRGHDPGRNRKSGGESADRDTLERLARTGDPLYQLELDYRAVAKVRGTYQKGTEKRLDSEDRLHPTFTFKPSTMRLSCVSPNIQNVVTDRGGAESLAAGFRRCVKAPAGHKILEFDFAGIEQVILGWLIRDPAYIRIAKLGTHALVASHLLKRPADLSWPDADLAAYFAEIKHAKGESYIIYDRSKRCVHGTAYGLTTYGMVRQFPKSFATLKQAEAVQQVYFSVAPGVPVFQQVVQHQAYTHHMLGGPAEYQYLPDEKRVLGHPYGYRHTFYDVVAYERLTTSQRIWREKRKMPITEISGIWYGLKLGEDGKRAIAYYPQSIARGVLTEAALDLFLPDDHPGHRADLYIGDAYYGRTPLRAPIHDSLLLEVPRRVVDRVAERVFAAMGAAVEELPCPLEWRMGPALTIGVDAKIGDDWSKEGMEDLAPPSVAGDVTTFAVDSEEESEMTDLGTRVA